MQTMYYVGPNWDKDEEWHRERLTHLPEVFAVDTETVSLVDKTLIGVGIGISPQESYYLNVLPTQDPAVEIVLTQIADRTHCKVYHNANYDLEVLKLHAGNDSTKRPDVYNIADTARRAQVSGHPIALDTVGRLLGIDGLFTISDLLAEASAITGKARNGAKQVNMLDVATERVAAKCGNDVRATMQMLEYFRGQLTEQQLDCYTIDKKVLSRLKQLEDVGFAIDHEVLSKHLTRLSKAAEVYRETANNLGFSISSPAQVGMFLARRGNILRATKSGRQLATDDEALASLDDPMAKMVLEFRSINKQLTTYVEPMLEMDRLYTHFRLDLSTGRLASFDRNMQNIPEDMRDIFMPDSGMNTWADISQLEMRIFAKMANEVVMLQAYKDGKDIHSITQEGLGLDRPRAKTFNFAMIYDALDTTLAKNTGLPVYRAGMFKQNWLGLYPGAARWMRERQHDDSPYAETMYGRRMLLPQVERWGRFTQAHVDKCKINWPVQGTGADIVKRGILYLFEHGYGDAYRLQVHDEHVLDGDIEFPKELDNLYPEVYTPHEVKKGPKWR